jgi:diaminopimelate decarboxylase
MIFRGFLIIKESVMELEIGNVKVSELVADYQTPLYVYDQEKIEATMSDFVENFKSEDFDTQILYASKAFQAVVLLNLVANAGLGLDVVSAGELFAATKSQMELSKIYFHGNNKTPEELRFALGEVGISHIVVDNLMELSEIAALSSALEREVSVMLRLNVGIEAHTHEYIITSHVDSKFGMAYEGAEAQDCLRLIEEHPFLSLEGFHSHIGSQIFDLTAWGAAIEKLVGYLADFDRALTLNIGGGFGIRYTEEDQPLPIAEVMEFLVKKVEAVLTDKSVSLKKLMIEPGRSLVAEAGTTLYTVGYQKSTPNKNYVFVDGGMGDNIRPSLYQAKYACDIANRLEDEKTETVTVAGKYCESGDVLIENVAIPKAQAGDILAIYSTGAYGYSMASNYNRNVIPAVVFVKDGQAREVIKRQTFAQLIENEVF